MFWLRVSALAALASFASALQFDGPKPTPLGELLGYDEHGWTPKPTSRPLTLPELFKRQQQVPELCGYLQGDNRMYSIECLNLRIRAKIRVGYPVSCSRGRSCLYDSVFSWFGCCTGTRITDCPVVTTCVENTRISSCLSNSACRSDAFLTAWYVLLTCLSLLN